MISAGIHFIPSCEDILSVRCSPTPRVYDHPESSDTIIHHLSNTQERPIVLLGNKHRPSSACMPAHASQCTQ